MVTSRCLGKSPVPDSVRLRDIRGRFIPQVTEEERRMCPRKDAPCSCPDEIMEECLHNAGPYCSGENCWRTLTYQVKVREDFKGTFESWLNNMALVSSWEEDGHGSP